MHQRLSATASLVVPPRPAPYMGLIWDSTARKALQMPRKVRDASLETRTARGKLKTRAKPYFRLIEPGLHVGYRRLTAGPGTWVARRYLDSGKYTAQNLTTPDGRMVIADDY